MQPIRVHTLATSTATGAGTTGRHLRLPCDRADTRRVFDLEAWYPRDRPPTRHLFLKTTGDSYRDRRIVLAAMRSVCTRCDWRDSIGWHHTTTRRSTRRSTGSSQRPSSHRGPSVGGWFTDPRPTTATKVASRHRRPHRGAVPAAGVTPRMQRPLRSGGTQTRAAVDARPVPCHRRGGRQLQQRRLPTRMSSVILYTAEHMDTPTCRRDVRGSADIGGIIIDDAVQPLCPSVPSICARLGD